MDRFTWPPGLIALDKARTPVRGKGKIHLNRSRHGASCHLLSLHYAVLNDHARGAQLIQRSYSFRRCNEKPFSHIIHFQPQCKHTFEEHRWPVVWHKVYCQKVAESSIQHGTCKPESLGENFQYLHYYFTGPAPESNFTGKPILWSPVTWINFFFFFNYSCNTPAVKDSNLVCTVP